MAKDLIYTKQLSADSSFQLVRTNPKLTGNVKITINEAGDMWLDSIKANLELAKDDYSRFPIDTTQSLAGNMYKFFKNGETPNEIIFGLTEKVETTKTSKDFKDQYDFSNYFSGIKYFPSNKYNERLSYFAPLYLKPEIPNYFVILKIKDPLNSKIDLSKQNFETGQSKSEFIIDLFKTATIIKTFDLSETSKPGKYIRSYINSTNFPVSPLSVSFSEDNFTTWNGIVIDSGILGSKGELLYDQYKQSTPLKFFEENITGGFERNGVIFPNILNLDFIFTDDTSDNYEFNRYLGLYVDTLELSKLDIDLTRLYDERRTWPNTPLTNKLYLESDDTTIFQSNSAGVVIPYNNIDFNMAEFEDIFSDSESLYFNYLADRDGKLHLPKLEQPYAVNYSEKVFIELTCDGTTATAISNIPHGFNTDDLVQITDTLAGLTGSYFVTKISDSQFTYLNTTSTLLVFGFAAKDIGAGVLTLSDAKFDFARLFGPSHDLFLQDTGFASQSAGFSHSVITINSNLGQLDEIRLYHPNGTNVDTNGKYDYYTAAVGYSLTPNPGDFYSYIDYDNVVGHDVFYFNAVGLKNEIAKALAGAINITRNRTFTAYAFNEYVFIKCNVAGEFDQIHQLSFSSPTAQYSVIDLDETSGTPLIGTMFQFNGGSKVTGNRLIVDREHMDKINQEINNILIKTGAGWSKIKKTSGYIDIVTEENSVTETKITSALSAYFNKCAIVLEDAEAPSIAYTEFIMRKKFRPAFGLLSLFPIKDISFDFYSSDYLNFPEIDFYQYYYIPEGLALLTPKRDSADLLYTRYSVINNGTAKIEDPATQATSTTSILLSSLSVNSSVTLNVGTLVTYGFDTGSQDHLQQVKIEYDADNYFIARVDNPVGYDSLTGNLSLIVLSLKSNILTSLSSWNIYQVALPGTQINPIIEFTVTQPCHYSNYIGAPIISQTTKFTLGDVTMCPIKDENSELRNFAGFSILKDPTKVVAADVSDEYTIKTKYVNGLTQTEYDFYKENESIDFALRSKIIPYITKWGIKNGLDSRDNPYRLNTEIVFGRNNFSPDHTDRSQNPNNFTHEWFYIESRFNYLDTLETAKQNNYYFDKPLDITKLLSDPNYFIEYFTYTPKFGTDVNGEDLDVAPTQFRYSEVFKNIAGQYEAFFKGFKLIFNVVNPNSTVFGADGKPVANDSTSRFDDYKFSCVLKPVKEDFFNRDQPPIRFRFIEHTDYKFITLVIELAIGSIDQIDSFWKQFIIMGAPPITIGSPTGLSSADPSVILPPEKFYTEPDPSFGTDLPFETIYGDYRIQFEQVDGVDVSNLNHTLLYSLKNKKYNSRLDNFSNIKLSLQLAISVAGTAGVNVINSNPDSGTIRSQEIASISNYPESPVDEFTPTSNLGLVSMRDSLSGLFYIIDQTDSASIALNSNPIDLASDNSFNFSLDDIPGGANLSLVTPIVLSPFTSIFLNLPLPSGFTTVIKNRFTFFVIGGGKNYFEKLLQKLSFSKFKQYLNTLDPIIEFESYSLDINGVSQLSTDPKFYLEIPDVATVENISQIIINSDIDVPPQFSFNNEIGYQYEQAKLNNVIELNRYPGGYEPITQDVLYCKSNFKFFKNKINDLPLSNTRLNTQIDNLLTITNFNHIKVANTKILDLESDPAYLPIYPKIGEVAIGQAPHFLLNSNWDWGFHHRYSNKTEYSAASGAVRVEEDENFLGKILTVPETIYLTQFNMVMLTDNQKLSEVDLTQIEIVAKEGTASLDGFINLNNAITSYLIADGIEQKFNDYLVNSTEFIGNYTTIKEYVKDYIKLNILKLYNTDTLEFFSKRNASLFSTTQVQNSNPISFVFLDDTQRKALGYSEFKNVQINKTDRLILSFSIPKSTAAGQDISPKIKIKFI